MSWTEVKIALNSTLGTNEFAPLNRIIEDAQYENYYNTFAANVDMLGDNGGRIIIVPRSSKILEEQYKDVSAFAIILPPELKEIGQLAFLNSFIKTAVIPNNVTDIGMAAFESCSKLINVKIGNGVNLIDQFAFSDCNHLKSIIIPNNVKTLKRSIFLRCSSMEEAVIGNGIIEIPNAIFMDCTSLSKITISSAIQNVGENAFSGCSALSDVYYGGTEEQWRAIDVAAGNDNLLGATIHYNS